MMNRHSVRILAIMIFLLSLMLFAIGCNSSDGEAGASFQYYDAPPALQHAATDPAPTADVSQEAPPPTFVESADIAGSRGDFFAAYESSAEEVWEDDATEALPTDAGSASGNEAEPANGYHSPDEAAPTGDTAYEASMPNDTSPERPTPQTHQAPAQLGIDLMQRMIIRSASIALNTLYYHDTIAGVEAIVANRGGFIESSNQRQTYCSIAGTLWNAQFTIRVPVGLFDTTNSELTALGQVQYFSTASRDATHEFNDLGSRLEIREAEETRVQRMLDEATDLNDIINLEARLTNLRLIIDAYRRRREEIDHLASFSTIQLTVSEVIILPEIDEEEIEEEDEEDYPIVVVYSFGQRIGGAFNTSANVTTQVLEWIGVTLALVILPLGMLIAILLLIYVIVKKVTGKPLWRVKSQ